MSWTLHDFDDPDAPQPIDLDDGDTDLDTVDCPACGRLLLEGAPRCPHCGHWFPSDTPAARRARGWLWPVMVAVLIAVILVIWHGLGR